MYTVISIISSTWLCTYNLHQEFLKKIQLSSLEFAISVVKSLKSLQVSLENIALTAKLHINPRDTAMNSSTNSLTSIKELTAKAVVCPVCGIAIYLELTEKGYRFTRCGCEGGK